MRGSSVSFFEPDIDVGAAGGDKRGYGSRNAGLLLTVPDTREFGA